MLPLSFHTFSFDPQEWIEEAARLMAQYKKDLARYKEGLTGSPTKAPAKAPAKSPAKATAKAPKKGRGSEKYKSAEFVKNNEDSSSEDDDSDN